MKNIFAYYSRSNFSPQREVGEAKNTFVQTIAMINRNVLTLDEFTIQQYRKIPNATGELSNLLRDIGLARETHQR